MSVLTSPANLGISSCQNVGSASKPGGESLTHRCLVNWFFVLVRGLWEQDPSPVGDGVIVTAHPLTRHTFYFRFKSGNLSIVGSDLADKNTFEILVARKRSILVDILSCLGIQTRTSSEIIK